MDEKSIELCGKRGDEAVEALYQKLAKPDLPLLVSGTLLKRIASVEHVDDGRPVITAQTADDNVLVFQFKPDYSSFSATAVDQDGQPICPDPI